MGWDRLTNLRLNPVIVIGHVLGISNLIYPKEPLNKKKLEFNSDQKAKVAN